jgi:DNA-binding transcriptional LysR family regulator
MRSQELNLLVIFDAIMTEASITKAGERLNMTQPAVSNAVARMRHVWKDDLFIKDGRKISPTIFAQRLWEETQSPLADIRSVLDPTDFEAASSDRAFKIAVIDSIAGLVWPQLRLMIEEEAPDISIHTYPFEFSNAVRALNDAKVEVLITASNLMPQLITRRFLCDLEYVTVMKEGHPLANKKITIEDYATADHLLVAPSGNIQGHSDQALAELGLKRKIGLSVNSFSSVPNILTQSNLICTLPSIYIEDNLLAGSLVALKPPVKVPNTRINIYWHKRSENDKGIRWLREKIEQLTRKRMAQHKIHMAELLD